MTDALIASRKAPERRTAGPTAGADTSVTVQISGDGGGLAEFRMPAAVFEHGAGASPLAVGRSWPPPHGAAVAAPGPPPPVVLTGRPLRAVSLLRSTLAHEYLCHLQRTAPPGRRLGPADAAQHYCIAWGGARPAIDLTAPDAWEQAVEAWTLADMALHEGLGVVAAEAMVALVDARRLPAALALVEVAAAPGSEPRSYARMLRAACLRQVLADFGAARAALEAAAPAAGQGVLAKASPLWPALRQQLADDLRAGTLVVDPQAWATLLAAGPPPRSAPLEPALVPALWRWLAGEGDAESLAALCDHQGKEVTERELLAHDAEIFRLAARRGRAEHLEVMLSRMGPGAVRRAILAGYFDAYLQTSSRSVACRAVIWRHADAALQGMLRRARDAQPLRDAAAAGDTETLEWLCATVYPGTLGRRERDLALAAAIRAGQDGACTAQLRGAAHGVDTALLAAVEVGDAALAAQLAPRAAAAHARAAFLEACRQGNAAIAAAVFAAARPAERGCWLVQGRRALALVRPRDPHHRLHVALAQLGAEAGVAADADPELLLGVVANGHVTWAAELMAHQTPAALGAFLRAEKVLGDGRRGTPLGLAVRARDLAMVRTLAAHAGTTGSACWDGMAVAARTGQAEALAALAPVGGPRGCFFAALSACAEAPTDHAAELALTLWRRARGLPGPLCSTATEELTQLWVALLCAGRCGLRDRLAHALGVPLRTASLPDELVHGRLAPGALRRAHLEVLDDVVAPLPASARVRLLRPLLGDAWRGGQASVGWILRQLPVADGRRWLAAAMDLPQLLAEAPVAAALFALGHHPQLAAAQVDALAAALKRRPGHEQAELVATVVARLPRPVRPALLALVGPAWLEAAARRGHETQRRLLEVDLGPWVDAAAWRHYLHSGSYFAAALDGFTPRELRALCARERDDAILETWLSFGCWHSWARVLAGDDRALIQSLLGRLSPAAVARARREPQVVRALRDRPEIMRFVDGARQVA